ncbi:MAG: UDP-N-acetylmuramoyl-tripeptide--D-alanyl-D-alanine ligase [Sphingobacteriaceae bacterium]
MVTTQQLYEIYLQHPVICTDTRKISPGCLYFALKGDQFDGNDFAEQALQAGAAYAIVDKKTTQNSQLLLVNDGLTALQELARHHRKQLDIPVIGITGSNGKTTTKELLYAVLNQHYCTFATHGNLNNHIGVPLSILSIGCKHKIAIIEMGANHQKEIEFLCSMAQPSHGLITNIGKAHLEGFGGIEGVKKGKGELYAYLAKTDGIAFVNHDSHDLMAMSRTHELNNVVYYGQGMDNYISGKILTADPFLKVAWERQRTEFDDLKHEVASHLTGSYNLENILAAIAVGCLFELQTKEINEGISGYVPSNNRSQITKTDKNTLICDYYNANPSSISAALANLDTLAAKQKVVILGDMYELGEESAQEHAAIIAKALALKAQRTIFIGRDFYAQKGSSGEFYADTAEAQEALKQNSVNGATVLVKGSRGMKLESLIELL